jgi:hypothetical protein
MSGFVSFCVLWVWICCEMVVVGGGWGDLHGTMDSTVGEKKTENGDCRHYC